MMQYFKRPWMIQPYIDQMVKCNVRQSRAWEIGLTLPVHWSDADPASIRSCCYLVIRPPSFTHQAEIPLELLVNVDHPQDNGPWAWASYNTSGLVVPVFSNNVHEVRSYNRLAHNARGDVLILVWVWGARRGSICQFVPLRLLACTRMYCFSVCTIMFPLELLQCR